MMQRRLLILGATFGVLAVIFGAFGAHALKEILSETQLNTFETGVRYQFYHAFLAMLAGVIPVFTEKTRKAVFFTLLIGVILFSGSIYLLATPQLTGINFKSIGFLTPIGGAFLIISWLILGANLLKTNKK